MHISFAVAQFCNISITICGVRNSFRMFQWCASGCDVLSNNLHNSSQVGNIFLIVVSILDLRSWAQWNRMSMAFVRFGCTYLPLITASAMALSVCRVWEVVCALTPLGLAGNVLFCRIFPSLHLPFADMACRVGDMSLVMSPTQENVVSARGLKQTTRHMKTCRDCLQMSAIKWLLFELKQKMYRS